MARPLVGWAPRAHQAAARRQTLVGGRLPTVRCRNIERGFTLIELLAAITLLALLATILMGTVRD
jgi:prepilin-type N-terminal cleavage/methylation domain-containing protein